MIAECETCCLEGMDVCPIRVQVHIGTGIPRITVVGLPDKSISEAKERIRACFAHMSLALPQKRIVVNLSPVDRKKEGNHYDLPIALSILAALGVIDSDALSGYLAAGELGLDGDIHPIKGALMTCVYAKKNRYNAIVPYGNREEVFWAGHEHVLTPKNLLHIVQHFQGRQVLTPLSLTEKPLTQNSIKHPHDLSDICGQESAKYALQIAAAGHHHMIFIGPPGVGKSMLAKAMIGILPSLTAQQALETTMLYSACGKAKTLITEPPFRAPHHSASMASLVGGGSTALPGEVSLAHNGVLFLDELPEYKPSTLDALRQPLEDGQVTVARAQAHVTYPARVIMVGAMNPCKCGMFGYGTGCSKAPKCAMQYQERISGPFWDRIALIVHVDAMDISTFFEKKSAQKVSSACIKKRIEQAQYFAKERSKQPPNTDTPPHIMDFGKKIAKHYNLSARKWHHALSVARTIADLEASQTITKEHMACALSFLNLKKLS